MPPRPASAIAVGSEEAPSEELASVRRTNRTYSFPVSGFHERAFAICSEGMSETRLTSLNSVRNRLVGYSFHAALRHRLVRCDHSLRITPGGRGSTGNLAQPTRPSVPPGHVPHKSCL